jgi:hypothetical protein
LISGGGPMDKKKKEKASPAVRCILLLGILPLFHANLSVDI